MRLRFVVVEIASGTYRMEGLRRERVALRGGEWVAAPLETEMWKSVLTLAQGAASLPVGVDGWDGRVRRLSKRRVEVEAWTV